jgi:GT2 family glycosyltransferase
MRLSVVIPTHGQADMSAEVYKVLRENTSPDVEFIIIDNCSEPWLNHLRYSEVGKKVAVVREDKNIGVYPTFKAGMDYAQGDIVAFLHSDMIVWEKDWDKRVVEVFKQNPKLGLMGFIGSDEIDSCGGRGRGTTSNFAGRKLETNIGTWEGSPAKAHGKTSAFFSNAAVVDGCSMILRREAWTDIGVREDFPPHHFYDRLISTQMLEKGWSVCVLGIECDHFSGRTVGREVGYDKMAEEWCGKHGLTMDGAPNWDTVIYKEAERLWLTEYRDTKHLVPIKVK